MTKRDEIFGIKKKDPRAAPIGPKFERKLTIRVTDNSSKQVVESSVACETLQGLDPDAVENSWFALHAVLVKLGVAEAIEETEEEADEPEEEEASDDASEEEHAEGDEEPA